MRIVNMPSSVIFLWGIVSMDQRFTSQTLAQYVHIWKQLQQGAVVSDNEALLADVLRTHPEFDPFWTQGDAALRPQEIGDYIVSPLIHVGLHVEIERQRLNQTPEIIGRCFGALREQGDSDHEAVHKLAGLWGDFYFRSIRQGAPFDEWGYVEALKGIARIRE